VSVSKDWLFGQGDRPVIYEHISAFDTYGDAQRYRLVPFDPKHGIDFTWEREWRIRADQLVLEPACTLVVVPTAPEAFHLMGSFVPSPAGGCSTASFDVQAQFHTPTWMAVSLDVLGFGSGIHSDIQTTH
jgi:hypothetical protein